MQDEELRNELHEAHSLVIFSPLMRDEIDANCVVMIKQKFHTKPLKTLGERVPRGTLREAVSHQQFLFNSRVRECVISSSNLNRVG